MTRIQLTLPIVLAVAAVASGEKPPKVLEDPKAMAPAERPLTPLPAPVRRPARGGVPLSVQVNVDAAGQNVPNDAANEPSIAVDPTDPSHIVIGWRQFDSITSDFRQAGYGYSSDGGATWHAGKLTPGVFRSDPVLSAADDGTFYYNSLLGADFSNDVFISTDGGASWSPPLDAFGGDKQWMIADTTPSVGNDNLYAYWSTAAGCCGFDVFTRSTTLAMSFDTPLPLPVDAVWGTLDVASDGTLYLVGLDGATSSSYWVFRSTDARDASVPVVSFDQSVNVDMGGSVGFGGPVNPAGLLGQSWVAVDRSSGPTAGWVYVLSSVDPPGGDPLDVRFSRSTDRGATWSPSIRVNDDASTTAHQWFGTMSVAPNGRIDAIWNDTRNDATTTESELYYAYSTDGGTTFSANVPMSPPWPHNVGYPVQQKIGDYYHMVSDDGGAHLAYAATFNGEQDVYYLRIPAPGGCPLIVIAPPALPAATSGTPYSVTLTASGGTAPYAFAVTGGALPPGVTLSPSGLLSGTPTATGSFAFDVTATDGAGCTGSRAYDLDVNDQCPVITVGPATLPPAVEGKSYGQPLTATGGTSPYTFLVTSGSLPPGLALSASGVISGTASAPGSFAFQVTATDAAGCSGARDYSLDVLVRADIVTGKGLGSPNTTEVRLFDDAGGPTAIAFHAYLASTWGVNVAAGNLDGGFYDELVTGAGPGSVHGPHVRGFLRDGTPLPRLSFYAYGTLRYGVNVAAPELDADPADEILTGAGPGEVFGPHVRGWAYGAGGISPMAGLSFFAYGTLRWGVNVAGSSVEGSSAEEIVTGPGPGIPFGPNVRAFAYDGTSVASIPRINFLAFATTQHGANVAGGDVDADGFGDMLATPGPGPSLGSEFAGFEDDGAGVRALPGFQVTPYATLYGGRVGSGDFSYDGRAELLTGPGRDPAAIAEVRAHAYDGAGLNVLVGPFVAYPLATYGVNVAGGATGY